MNMIADPPDPPPKRKRERMPPSILKVTTTEEEELERSLTRTSNASTVIRKDIRRLIAG